MYKQKVGHAHWGAFVSAEAPLFVFWARGRTAMQADSKGLFHDLRYRKCLMPIGKMMVSLF